MEDRFRLSKTDPDFAERMEHFTFCEVVTEPGMELDDKTRMMAILAVLLGSQSLDVYKFMAEAALDGALTPAEVKEITYQAVDYLGIGKVYPFLTAANEIMTSKGIRLPLESRKTTTMENRLEKGVQIQVEVFGEGMRESWKAGPVNRWLAANCFGDYYTRSGLDLKQREMVTFCFLMAQGGCEAQLGSHAMGNMMLGNDRQYLTKVVSQCVPYIGYPRSLNAITCINLAADQLKKNQQ